MFKGLRDELVNLFEFILLFTWWLSSSLGGALREDNLFWNITFLSPIFKEEVSLNPFQIQRNGEILDHFSIN